MFAGNTNTENVEVQKVQTGTIGWLSINEFAIHVITEPQIYFKNWVDVKNVNEI